MDARSQRSMDRAQHAYDNHTPWDNDPPEPNDKDVDDWADDEDSIPHNEWEELDNPPPYETWKEENWQHIVDLYIENYEEPEPYEER